MWHLGIIYLLFPILDNDFEIWNKLSEAGLSEDEIEDKLNGK